MDPATATLAIHPATLAILGGTSVLSGVFQAKIAKEQREADRKKFIAAQQIDIEKDKTSKINNALLSLQDAFKTSLIRQTPNIRL